MNRLATYRTAAGLTQRQLAQMAGCSDAMIAAIEVGSRRPGPRLALHIAQALNVRVSEVFPELADFFAQVKDGGVA